MLISPKAELANLHATARKAEVKTITDKTRCVIKIDGDPVSISARDFRDTLIIFADDHRAELTTPDADHVVFTCGRFAQAFKMQPLNDKRSIWLSYSGTGELIQPVAAPEPAPAPQPQPIAVTPEPAAATMTDEEKLRLQAYCMSSISRDPEAHLPKDEPLEHVAYCYKAVMEPASKSLKDTLRAELSQAVVDWRTAQAKPIDKPEVLPAAPKPRPAPKAQPHPIYIDRAAGVVRYCFAPDTPREARDRMYKEAYRLLKSDNPKAGTKRGPKIQVFEYGFQISA